jgi:hypothetical protein
LLGRDRPDEAGEFAGAGNDGLLRQLAARGFGMANSAATKKRLRISVAIAAIDIPAWAQAEAGLTRFIKLNSERQAIDGADANLLPDASPCLTAGHPRLAPHLHLAGREAGGDHERRLSDQRLATDLRTPTLRVPEQEHDRGALPPERGGKRDFVPRVREQEEGEKPEDEDDHVDSS